MGWSGFVALLQGIPSGLVSLSVGLWGVVLARWVFVNRENRLLPRRQGWRETLPVTLAAMLITSVVVHDRNLGLSAAAFTGLGVGWSAVLLLDLFGERIAAAFRAGFAMPVPPHVANKADMSGQDGVVTDREATTPPDMAALIDQLDKDRL